MNDVDFKETYDAAFQTAQRAAGPDTKTALFHILCLIDALRSDIVELQRSTIKDG